MASCYVTPLSVSTVGTPTHPGGGCTPEPVALLCPLGTRGLSISGLGLVVDIVGIVLGETCLLVETIPGLVDWA